MKAKKNNKVKRIVAIYLAVVFVLSAVAVFGVSAKVYTWEHTIELASISGDSCNVGISMGGTGRMSDAFQSYPTIYNGYTKSVNQARAVHSSGGYSSGWERFTLYDNSAGIVTVSYGDTCPYGFYEVSYKNYSHGGCKADSIFSMTY